MGENVGNSQVVVGFTGLPDQGGIDPGAPESIRSSVRDQERTRGLCTLCQGKESVNNYAICFHMLAKDNRWNTAALTDVFLKGPTEQIQDLFILMDLQSDLDSLIALAVKTNQRL